MTPAEVRRARTDMRGTSFVNGAGTQVASIDSDVVGGRAGEDVEIMRGDLNRILYNQVESDVEYLFDDSVTSITENEGRVRVTFEHGRARTFDAVVGADGPHSHTRALTFGADSQFVRDLGYYVSIFDLPNHLDLDRRELIYPLPGKTALLYSTAGSTDAKAMFFFASPPLDYDRRDLAQQHTLLADAFAGVGWEVPRTLASMAEASDFYFDSLSQIRMQQWWRGRTVLVGDAAYCASPASGQGTSLALVGAYVLAGELAAAAGDHQAAFDRYQATMREFVEENQKLGPSNIKGIVLRSRFQIWSQLQVLRALPRIPGGQRIIGRVTRAIHDAATAITLDEYGVNGHILGSMRKADR